MEANAAFTIWITGLPVSGKTTLSEALHRALRSLGLEAEVIDSGRLRATALGANLGFSPAERDLNVRRHGLAALLLVRHGVIAIVAAVSPYRATRAEVRRELGEFVEVYVATPKSACIDRDDRGLWRRALAGEIRDFTGVDAPYEAPLEPEVTVDLSQQSVDAAVAQILACLEQRGRLGGAGPRIGQETADLAVRLKALGYEV